MRRAFTLLELLATLAICAILLLALLPALASARAAARDSVCLSNLRQIATEWTVGVTAHREQRTFLPGEYTAASQLRCPANRRWYNVLVLSAPLSVRAALSSPSVPVTWDQDEPHRGRTGFAFTDGRALLTSDWPTLPAGL